MAGHNYSFLIVEIRYILNLRNIQEEKKTETGDPASVFLQVNGLTGGFPLTLGNSLLYRIPDQPLKPFVIERLFGPDYRFQGEFKLISAGLTKVPVSHMEIRTLVNRSSYVLMANIAFQTFHNNSSF
jgi:hypothetical protein